MSFEYAGHADYLVALLPEALLAVAAMAVLLGDVFARRGDELPSGAWTGHLSAAAVVAAAGAVAWLAGMEVAAEPPMVAMDGFRWAADFIVLGAAFLGILYAGDYLEREGLRRGEFYVLLLLSTVGMMVLVGARDLVLVFLGLELMSIAVYVLTAFDRANPRSAEAGLKYFLVGAFASGFLLYGIALLYGAAGSTDLGRVASEVARAAEAGDLLLVAGIGFFLIGLGFKIAAVPFHMWTPDAYQGAPTPVTAFMAAGVKAAAFVALLRVVVVQLAPAIDVWGAVLWWLAMLTMIVPNLIALAQDNVKRMLAYSSVAHAGYLLVGVVAGTAMGMAAALFYLAVYTLMTLGAFAIVYHVAGPGDRHERLSDYRGLGWRRPGIGLALLVLLLSLAGFPPTGGFVGKLYLLRASVEVGEVALAVTLVVTTLVSYYYYFRVVWKMYFDEAPAEAEAAPAPAAAGGAFRLATAACALGVLAAGLLPGPLLRGMDHAGRSAGVGADVTRERPPAARAAPPEGPAVSRQPGADRDPGAARTP